MIMSNVFAHDDTVFSLPLLLALPWMATPLAVIELAVACSHAVDRSVILRKREAVNSSLKGLHANVGEFTLQNAN